MKLFSTQNRDLQSWCGWGMIMCCWLFGLSDDIAIVRMVMPIMVSILTGFTLFVHFFKLLCGRGKDATSIISSILSVLFTSSFWICRYSTWLPKEVMWFLLGILAYITMWFFILCTNEKSNVKSLCLSAIDYLNCFIIVGLWIYKGLNIF